MTTPAAVTIKLDRERELRWGPRAQIRLDSLPRRPSKRGIYQLAALLWAMLVDDEGFAAPEDLGEYMDTPDKMAAVGRAILAAQKAGSDSEKNGHGSTQKHAPASS